MLEVSLLGKFEIRLGSEPINIRSRSAQVLLAYLMLNGGKFHRREKLAGLLWPESSEANARNNLRQVLWRLRKSLGDGYLSTDKIAVGLDPKAEYTLDVDILREDISENPTTEWLIRVVSAYGGALLPGFYQAWIMPVQSQLQGIFEDRMQMLLDRLGHERRWREVRDWAEWWVSMGTVPEPAYRALMMAAAGLGDRGGVAAAFQRCVEMLKGEIEILL